MRIIYCDFCGKNIGDVSVSGVEMVTDGKESLRVGNKEYKELCGKCYRTVYEFIEELKKKK